MNKFSPCKCGHSLQYHKAMGGRILCDTCVFSCTKKEGECSCYHSFKLDNLKYLEFEAKRRIK
jgi:hypothetical protein